MTNDVTFFRNLEKLSRVSTKNERYYLKEQRLPEIEARFGLSMPENTENNSYFDQIIDG